MQASQRSTRKNINNIRKFTSKAIMVVCIVVAIIVLGVIIDTMAVRFFSNVV